MVTKIIFTIVFFFNILIASSQIKISFDRDCRDKNTILLAQLLIDAMGDGFVSNFLDEDNAIVLFFDVDSLGHIVDASIIKERKELGNCLRKKIISALKSSDIKFTVCYQKIEGSSESKAYEYIKSWFAERPTYTINVAFPGDVIGLYRLEKSTRDSHETELSKLQFFKKLIDESHKK